MPTQSMLNRSQILFFSLDEPR